MRYPCEPLQIKEGDVGSVGGMLKTRDALAVLNVPDKDGWTLLQR